MSDCAVKIAHTYVLMESLIRAIPAFVNPNDSSSINGLGLTLESRKVYSTSTDDHVYLFSYKFDFLD